LLIQFGYLDPGTGSLVLQAVIGILLGAVVFFRSFFIRLFGRIKAIFHKNNNDEKKFVKSKVSEK
jgi:hypothetical protein